MGVRSKALRMIVLLAAVGWVGACSFSQPVEEAAQPAGDRPDRATIGANSQELSGATSEPTQVASEELLRRDGGGVGIVAERSSAANRYVVDLGKTEPVFDVTMVSNPPRIVVDVLGEKGAVNKDLQLADDGYLKSIRLGAHKDRTRIVFDLKQSVTPENLQHEVTTEGGKLVVTLQGENGAALARNAAPAPIAEAAPVADAEPMNVAAEAPAEAPVEAVAAVAPVAVDAPVQMAANDAEVPAEAPPVTVAEEVAPAAAPVAKLSTDATVQNVSFEKSVNDAGKVVISTSEPVAFELSKTAPSEYTLNIPGATPSDQALLPQIAPKGVPGIRTVRTSRQGGGTVMRMFVDGGTDLRAVANDNTISIKVDQTAVASRDVSARAQLEAGDTPTAKDAKAGDAKPAESKTANVAATPNDEIARQNPSGLRSADGSKLYTGRLISLDLQDTDIDNALRIIAEVSNLNIIASDDVTGKVTLRLIDVPWDQALDVILKTNGLDQVTEGNVIRIAPIDKLRQEREALREAEKAKQLLEKLTVEYIRVSYARATELKEQVEAVLSERGSVSVDERTNQLIIKDVGDGHTSARELLKRLDLRTPQVLLETQIIESGRNILRDLGFQWNFSYTQSPGTGNATGLNFPNSVNVGGSTPAGNLVSFPAVITDQAGSAVAAVLDSADGSRSLSARLTALETERKVKVISRPQVATVNNKQAEISSVETFRVRTPSSGTAISTGSGASASGSANNAFEEIKVGIELTVTPQASPDYFVLLDVKAKSSTLGPGSPVDNIPPTLDRQATSTILVKSGQTFALGGVYRLDDSDQVEGVPFLKDIPFLGAAFRRNFIQKQDEELIFFITPHIVEGSFDPSLM